MKLKTVPAIAPEPVAVPRRPAEIETLRSLGGSAMAATGSGYAALAHRTDAAAASNPFLTIRTMVCPSAWGLVTLVEPLRGEVMTRAAIYTRMSTDKQSADSR